MKEFKTIVAKEALDGIINDIKCSSDYVEEVGVKSYECYIDGFHIDNHYDVTVTEKELQIAQACMEQVKTFFSHLSTETILWTRFFNGLRSENLAMNDIWI